jgi:hypothetical protein
VSKSEHNAAVLILSLRSAERWMACAALTVLGACSAGSVPGALPSQQLSADVPRVQPHSAGGASLVYSGTLTQTATGAGPKTLTVAEQVLASAGPGADSVVYHGSVTNAGGGSMAKASFQADVAQAKSHDRIGSNVELLKTFSTSGGVSVITTYGAGNGIVDELPEVPQARWNNGAAATESITDTTTGSSATDHYFADGSYTESGVPVEGRTASVQSYPDGNAIYQWPYEGASQNASISYSPPSGGKLDIDFVNTAQLLTTFYIIDSWYPTAEPLLAHDSFADEGSVELPSACGVSKTYGATAVRIDEKRTRLDVVFGNSETTQRTVYVSPRYGLLCYSVNDDLRTYYDYAVAAFESKPLTETQWQLTLGLHQASGVTSPIAQGSIALPLDAMLVDSQDGARLSEARSIYNALKHVRSHR